MKIIVIIVLGLVASTLFMTFAWHGHLKNFKEKWWLYAALLGWFIALFEYLIQVPTNRYGHQQLSVGQLNILQEVITLTVFIPFAYCYLREPFRPNYV